VIDRGGVITGESKSTHRHKAITTYAMGPNACNDFIDDNPGIEFWPSTTPTTRA